jgi:hypothetical protein
MGTIGNSKPMSFEDMEDQAVVTPVTTPEVVAEAVAEINAIEPEVKE